MRCLAKVMSVLAVGACDLEGRPLAFSNFGDSYAGNGILAPGQDVAGASPRAGVVTRSGTSFAAPVVTGVAALLLSLLHQGGRDPAPQAVHSALLASASPCPADEQGPSGRCLAGPLNVAGAAAALFESPSEDGALRAAGLSGGPSVARPTAVAASKSQVVPQAPPRPPPRL